MRTGMLGTLLVFGLAVSPSVFGQGNQNGQGQNGQGQNDQGQDTPPSGKGDQLKDAKTGGAFKLQSMSYHGGPLLTGTPNVYFIWYGNWSGNDPAAVGILTNLAHGISGSPYFNINQTYTVSGKTITGLVNYVGSYADSGSLGTNLSDSNIQTIVTNAIPTLNGTAGADTNGVYFVLTSPEVNESSGFCTQYCGWHTRGTIGGKDVKFAFVGDPARCPSACSAVVGNGPNGDVGGDAMASIVAHELEESVTDPDLNAWYDRFGNENADKCAWNFGTTYNTSNSSTANMVLGGKNYLIQQNWHNTLNRCALAK